MIYQEFKDVYDEKLAGGAIINDRHTGHKEDYLLLHVLLKRYRPKTFFEVGTNTGFGTKIIKNALGPGSIVYSLDLPSELAFTSKQHPISEGKGDVVGYECNLPYYQKFGDSCSYEYGKEPCEGYFIDAEHSYENVFIETSNIARVKPKIIVWHDADENEVFNAIVAAMKYHHYDLYRVVDTRIMYALRKTLKDGNA